MLSMVFCQSYQRDYPTSWNLHHFFIVQIGRPQKIELSFATIDITPLLVTCIGNYLIVPYIGFLHQNIQEDYTIVFLLSSEEGCYINSCSV